MNLVALQEQPLCQHQTQQQPQRYCLTSAAGITRREGEELQKMASHGCSGACSARARSAKNASAPN